MPGVRRGLPDAVGRNGLAAGLLKVVMEARGDVGVFFDDQDVGRGVVRRRADGGG